MCFLKVSRTRGLRACECERSRSWKNYYIKKKRSNGREKIIYDIFSVILKMSHSLYEKKIFKEKYICGKFIPCLVSWKIHDICLWTEKDTEDIEIRRVTRKIRVLVRQIFSELTESFSENRVFSACFLGFSLDIFVIIYRIAFHLRLSVSQSRWAVGRLNINQEDRVLSKELPRSRCVLVDGCGAVEADKVEGFTVIERESLRRLHIGKIGRSIDHAVMHVTSRLSNLNWRHKLVFRVQDKTVVDNLNWQSVENLDDREGN